MSDWSLDAVDRRILYLLQEDARNNTNAAISDQLGVSPSTVGTRIRTLEERGVVTGYEPTIDYDRAGFPLRVLFVCTAPIPERADLVQRTLDVPGVVTVRELMTGDRNLHVEVVGETNDHITELATRIDDLGIAINDEILVKARYDQPASVFSDDDPD